MSFELTKSFLQRIEEDVELGRDSDIRSSIGELHPTDIANILDRLEFDEARYVLRLLENETAAEAVLELDEDVREKLLEGLTSEEIASTLIDNFESDDAALVMSELPEQKAKEVLDLIEDEDHADDIEELLGYEDGTAGAFMGKELVQVRSDWTVARAILEMRKQAQEVEHVYSVYVVDKDDVLVGILPLKDLLFSAESTRTLIKHLCDTEVVSVKVDDEAEDVISTMKRYDVVVLPVVDSTGHLVGRITFDDVMDVMEEEAEKDYQLASGISEDVDMTDSLVVLTRARLPWLLIGMMGGILSSQIIGMYEEQIRIDPRMAFFMPLIAATGGNVGIQSSAIVVQGLAARTIQHTNLLGRLFKEIMVGSITAIICALLMFAVNLLLGEGQALTYTVSIALFTVILIAATFGTLIPLALDKLNVDPALATGPFVTTLNDIFGLITYFGVGHLMYEIFR